VGATADTIWRVPVYLPYLQPPLTHETVALAEEQIGHALPDEYVALLKKQNGGYIRFSIPDMTHRLIAGIGPNFPSLTRWFALDDLQECVSFPLQGLVPFDGDGHWYLCLDYRENSKTPSVTYADIELDRESPIADSFAVYLSKLQIDIDKDEYVLEAVSDIEVVKAELSASLDISFDPPDSWAHGYPQHRARLGTKTSPEWVWLSPNDVPRGFVRTDEPKYIELKDLMPGYAARFPELPPDSYLLSTPEDMRSKAIKACNRSGLIVRPLSEYLQ
jgi:SMI1-KNR4 cell-wall